jgi:hypothetical protein
MTVTQHEVVLAVHSQKLAQVLDFVYKMYLYRETYRYLRGYRFHIRTSGMSFALPPTSTHIRIAILCTGLVSDHFLKINAKRPVLDVKERKKTGARIQKITYILFGKCGCRTHIPIPLCVNFVAKEVPGV